LGSDFAHGTLLLAAASPSPTERFCSRQQALRRRKPSAAGSGGSGAAAPDYHAEVSEVHKQIFVSVKNIDSVLARGSKPFDHVARAHERKRAPRLATPTYLVQCSFNCLCASLSLSLSLAPHPKKISKHASNKIRRLSRTARKREVARTWPTRRRRARARHLRTARAREVARTWPSYEMVRDTAQSFTRRCEMVRDTVTVHRALRGATRWCATL
jgi:hypothetical protein